MSKADKINVAKRKKRIKQICQEHMRRYKIIPISETLLHKLVAAKPLGDILVEGYPIDVDTDRYENLYKHGWICAKCGAKATFAAIERNYSSKGKYHINFYFIREDGKEICITKDHIYPRILGGFDDLNNYQTLCNTCNANKNNHTDLTIDEAVAAGYTSYERAAAATQIQKEQAKYNALLTEAAAKKKYIDELKEQYGLRDKSEFIRED